MTQATATGKVLDRVKKMLALGNDSAATEGERETALRMAYNLLAKYNLTINDLPGDQQEEGRERADIVIYKAVWARSLAHSIANLFFCKYYFTRALNRDSHYFIGRASNVVTASYMTDHIVRSIKKEAGQRYGVWTSPEGRSFCVGAAAPIRQRIAEMLEKDTESTVGSALALIAVRKTESMANDAWLANEGTRLVSKKARASRVQGEAYGDGKAFGATVSLAAQVGAQNSAVKMLG